MRLNFNSTISTRTLKRSDEYTKNMALLLASFLMWKCFICTYFSLESHIPDLRRTTAVDSMNPTHAHIHTHTWSNDTTLIELNDRSDFEIKKKLLHYDFAVVLFKSLMDLWTPSLSFDCWKFRLHFWGTKYGSTVTDI